MHITKSHYRKYESSRMYEQHCTPCGIISEHLLYWRKSGLGIGIPVVSWFTDKTIITISKKYALECQKCYSFVEVSKSEGKRISKK